MYVSITPDTKWLLSRIEFVLSLWETLDDQDAKDHAIAYLGELKQYLGALNGKYHAPAVLDRADGVSQVRIESCIADPCGNEIL